MKTISDLFKDLPLIAVDTNPSTLTASSTNSLSNLNMVERIETNNVVASQSPVTTSTGKSNDAKINIVQNHISRGSIAGKENSIISPAMRKQKIFYKYFHFLATKVLPTCRDELSVVRFVDSCSMYTYMYTEI